MVQSVVFAVFFCFLATSGVSGNHAPTVYDVLSLVYQLCSSEEYRRSHNLDCVNSHLGAEVKNIMLDCMVDKKNVEEEEPIDAMCDKLTNVAQWTNKYNYPPPHLTSIIGLEALGRMACVLGGVQRPLSMWQAAFSKCFPNAKYGKAFSNSNLRTRVDDAA